MGRLTSTTTRGSRLVSGLPKTSGAFNLEDAFNQYKIPVPEKSKKGWGILNKILDTLRTGEYAMGGVLSGKGIWAGIKEKISPSEVLFKDTEEERKFFSVKGIAALATDILLDPTTYLTFGVGGATKITTKTGAKIALSKAGKQMLKKVVKAGASRKSAARVMARVIEKGGEKAAKKYIAKSGLKFLGEQIIPRKAFTVAGIPLKWTLGKIPGFNKAAKVFEKALKPFAEINAMPAKLGGKSVYQGAEINFIKTLRWQQTKTWDEWLKKVKPFYKQKGKDIGKTIGWRLESKKLTGDVMVDGLIKTMKKESAEMLKLERAAGKKIGEISGYVRHYLTPDAREWIGRGGNLFTAVPKSLRARLASSNKRKIAGAIREINSQFKITTGLKFNFFEPDAIKAFAMRKAEHIRFINTSKFIERIKGFGMRATYKNKKLVPTFKEGVEFLETTNPQLKGIVFPKPIAKHIDAAQRALTDEGTLKGIVSLYDKGLAIWKGTVTGYFPAFHTRNFIGGFFNNWLAGVKNIARYKQWNDIEKGANKLYTTKLGEKIKGSEIFRQGELKGVFGQSGMMDVARSMDRELKTLGAKLPKKIWDKTLNPHSGYPRVMMEYVENHLRGPLFLDRVLKGDSYAEAARWVFRYHFDYMPEGLTGFERNVMKRLIPFYTWMRNNIPLQIEQMLKQPGKYAGLEKIRKHFMGKEGEEEMKNLPEWMREQFITKLPFLNKMGKSLWLQLDLPLEDVAKLPISASGIRELVSALSPVLKYPIERYTNKDLYFGSEIYPEKLKDYPEFQTRKLAEGVGKGLEKILPPPLKKFLNFKKTKYRDYTKEKETGTKRKLFLTRYEMDAKKLHLLRSAFGRFYSTIGQIFDPEMKSKFGAIKMSRLLGGVPVRPFDIEEEKERRNWEEETEFQAILNYLKKHGEVPYKESGRKKERRKL